MSFEATLQSIDASLKALLVVAQSSASAVQTFGETAANVAEVKATRKAKTEPAKNTTLELPGVPSKDAGLVTTAPGNALGTVDGDPAGTRYWLIEKHNTVYAQKPGEIDCSIQGAVITTAAEYLAKKAEFAKKSVIPPVADVQSTASVAALTADATASPALSSAPTPSFKEVTDQLILLARDERPGKGRPALVELLAKYLPDVDAAARKVPSLSALGKNSEIMADVMWLLASDADIFG